MAIPTDTFWNIRRLNVVFALSSLALVAVCGWAIEQDYEKAWRPLQQQGRVWDAALTEEKIKRAESPEVKASIKQLTAQIEAKKIDLDSKDQQYQQATAAVTKAEAEIASISFGYNNLKANVGVMESQLQDAKTRNEPETIQKLTRDLQEPEKTLAAQGETLAGLKQLLSESRLKAKARAKDLDDLQKQKKKLNDDIEALKKRDASLIPQTLLAKLSEAIRSAPLLQFLNPADRVKPIFIPDVRMDVSFATIDTIDRCATCHTHIDNKAFTREKVYGYLEEELAGVRKYRYLSAAKAKSIDPIDTRPMATAMPEFWHFWGRKLLAPASLDKTKGKINGVFFNTKVN